MTTPSTTNGKPTTRKQLSDQLDRLDGIIDTLAVGLNQAVADACREGARAAVREVILELISNPDLMAAVRATVPAPTVLHVTTEEPVTEYPTDEPPAPKPPVPKSAPKKPSFWGRVKAGVKSAVSAVTGAARTLVKSVEGAIKPATDALKLTGTTRTVVAAALGVGACTGALCFFCPTWMAAAFAGVTGAAAVGAAYIGARVNALFASLRAT